MGEARERRRAGAALHVRAGGGLGGRATRPLSQILGPARPGRRCRSSPGRVVQLGTERGRGADDRAPDLRTQMSDALAIEHVGVVRPEASAVDPDQTILVDRGRITWIGPASAARVPPEAARVDATGRFAMPGLADMHAHPDSERDLLFLLAHGITTIRNMAGHARHIDWRDRIDHGELADPRLYTLEPGHHVKPSIHHAAAA